MNPRDKWNAWRAAKIKNDGWKRVSLFVPGPLAIAIKELCRRFKYENPTLYKKG